MERRASREVRVGDTTAGEENEGERVSVTGVSEVAGGVAEGAVYRRPDIR